MVHGAAGGAYGHPGAGLAGHRRGQARPGDRPHGKRQDPHRLSLGDQSARHRRLGRRADPRPLRLAAQGPQQRHPAEPHRPPGGAPARFREAGAAFPRDLRPDPERRYAGRRAAADAAAAAGDPDHDPREPEHHPQLPERPGDADGDRHGHPRRDPCRRRHEARDAPDHGRRAPGPPHRRVPADRPLRDGEAAWRRWPSSSAATSGGATPGRPTTKNVRSPSSGPGQKKRYEIEVSFPPDAREHLVGRLLVARSSPRPSGRSSGRTVRPCSSPTAAGPRRR